MACNKEHMMFNWENRFLTSFVWKAFYWQELDNMISKTWYFLILLKETLVQNLFEGIFIKNYQLLSVFSTQLSKIEGESWKPHTFHAANKSSIYLYSYNYCHSIKVACRIKEAHVMPWYYYTRDNYTPQESFIHLERY